MSGRASLGGACASDTPLQVGRGAELAAAGHAAYAVQWCESLALALGAACCCTPQFDCVAHPVHICHLACRNPAR